MTSPGDPNANAATSPALSVARWQQTVLTYIRGRGVRDGDTLLAWVNLGHERGQAGDPAAAQIDLEFAAGACARELGPDHSTTLAAAGLAAYWRGTAGIGGGRVRRLLDHQVAEPPGGAG
ncbi:MAG: hypothetical protein JOZ49_20420 [Mycolicibacterium sp.]|nr:hypothetical protein [Mycolicibacterium sp.]